MSVVVKGEYSGKVMENASLGVVWINVTIFDQNWSYFYEYSLFIRIFVRTNMKMYSNLTRSSFERTTDPKIEDSWTRISTLPTVATNQCM